MRKSKFTESDILTIFNAGEVGLPVAKVYRKHGIRTPPTTNGTVIIQAFQAIEFMRIKGHNMWILLRKLRLFCAHFRLALQDVLQAISLSQRTNYRGSV